MILRVFSRYRHLKPLQKLFLGATALAVVFTIGVELRCAFGGSPSDQNWLIKYGEYGRWQPADDAEECRINVREHIKKEFSLFYKNPYSAYERADPRWLTLCGATVLLIMLWLSEIVFTSRRSYQHASGATRRLSSNGRKIDPEEIRRNARRRL